MLALDIDSKNLKPPYLIHSDIFKSFGLIKNEYKRLSGKAVPASLHLNLLVNSFGREHLVFPSFNYSFPKDKTFNLKTTQSDVGALTNYLISNSLFDRTETPIFSFLTEIKELLSDSRRPFSKGSVFDYLYSKDGTIIFYGAEISACTYLHYVEDQYGPPLFRYDKKFTGSIVDGEEAKETWVEFHVRPLGLDLDYNWELLYELLLQKNVVHKLAPSVFAICCRDISRIWGEFFTNDQFSILSADSKESVKNHVKQLGRRFLQTDFEVAK